MTLIVTLPPAIGVLWTIGMLGFTNERLNSLSMVIMPIILTMIGFTNAAHIVFQFRRELSEGSCAKEAMAASMRKLGLPCMLSALTTAAGFASLTVAEANMISDFGRDCAVGTLITFMAVVLLLPLLGLLPFKHKIQINKKSLQLDSVPGKGFFLKFIRSVIKHSKWVVTVSVILTILFGWLTSTLKPDMYLLNQLPDNSESGQALIEADKSLGGIQAIRIVAEWKSDDSDPVPIIASIEEMVKEEKLLSQPLSIRGVLSSLPGLGKDLSLRMPLLKRAPPDLIKPLYRPDLKKAVIITRIQDLGVAQYTPVYERLENKLQKLSEKNPGYEFRLAGGAVGWGRYVHRMLNDLARSLAAAAIIILIMITIAYRSLRIGLIAMIPNLFPLLACAAVLATFELPLSLEIVCAFTICLGIAADDAIHFLSRYQAERRNGLNIDQALECSFMRVGQVLIATTVVMLCGLGSVLFSSLPMYRAFTAVACATLSTALIADLIILPALLKLFHNKKD
ncbi:MAG: MMPL family transporter [Verrucomicrobiota bacterium]|nr:MMPL family transporter [Verrucomicrobiota bacterium]